MARLTNDEKQRLQEYAKLLYVRENITSQTELAQKVGVTVKTIAQWINDGNWERYKRNLVLTRNEQMALLLEELEELNSVIQNKEEGKRYADYKESNIRRNLIKDIKELETKASVSEAINALTGFLNFMRSQNLEKAQEVSHWVDVYIKDKMK
ncbi:transcriptional regulator [Capnocytophaga canis]|uniref:transcriptional regulator n=1 Tax=Capnocytophaga canis TaxID=1848903 RepID=UPI0015627D94|nr:transcriptional regulator [Capnocytophaga canis]